MKQFLEIGKIVAPSGLKGEVRIQPWSDRPEVLQDFSILYFDSGEKPVKLEKARVLKNMVVAKLEGVEDVEAANALRGKTLWIDRRDMRLEKGVYFVQDLLGMTVVDADHPEITYGTLAEVSATGANDVYHIEKEGRLTLIPAIPQVVVETDVEGGVLRIRPLKGLFGNED